MDTAIKGGDFLKDSRGMPIVLEGFDEILQRVKIRLEIEKGTFLYDKNLGSHLHSLKPNMENLNDLALSYAREAIAPMCGVEIESAEVVTTDSGMEVILTVLSDNEYGEVAIEV